MILLRASKICLYTKNKLKLTSHKLDESYISAGVMCLLYFETEKFNGI